MPFNQFQPTVAFLIETSHLFCPVKQMTGFYMKRNSCLKLVECKLLHLEIRMNNVMFFSFIFTRPLTTLVVEAVKDPLKILQYMLQNL